MEKYYGETTLVRHSQRMLRVTLPIKLCERLGLKPGVKFRWKVKSGKIVIEVIYL